MFNLEQQKLLVPVVVGLLSGVVVFLVLRRFQSVKYSNAIRARAMAGIDPVIAPLAPPSKTTPAFVGLLVAIVLGYLVTKLIGGVAGYGSRFGQRYIPKFGQFGGQYIPTVRRRQ